MSITINADDFGIDRGTSEFIKTCIKKGYVNTTTVLINMEDYKETYELIKRADLIERVGLHLNLTEGRPISDGISRCFSFCKDGKFGQYKKHKYKRFFCRKKKSNLWRRKLNNKYCGIYP